MTTGLGHKIFRDELVHWLKQAISGVRVKWHCLNPGSAFPGWFIGS